MTVAILVQAAESTPWALLPGTYSTFQDADDMVESIRHRYGPGARFEVAMPDPTNAKRQRRWRERRKAGIAWQPLICQACSSPHRGVHGVLCSRCWERLTPEGRAAKAERVRRSRARRRVD